MSAEGGSRSTIGVSLWDGQQRGSAPNTPTLMRPAVRVPLDSRAPRDLFLAAYARIAEPCRTVEEPGIAIVAVDEETGRAAGIANLIARVQRPVTAIVGRHDRCDLYLHGRDQLSLRQLAVVLEPVTSFVKGATVRYSVLDLRTTEGMVGEDGKRLRGLAAEGPAILRCGGYTLFILTLGDPTDWPASASDAWSMLPERVYFDEIESCAAGSLPRIKLPRPDVHQTFITRTHGPRDTGMRLAQGDAAGTLEIIGPHRRLAMTIGHIALRDGVLLGRYGRCDATDATGEDNSLSRVHALLLHIGDRLILIDTASSNGTHVAGAVSRVTVLEQDTEVLLGKKTRVRWRWSS
jgi:hypothetical protein